MNKKNQVSADWLKRAGYLDTEGLDGIQYNYIANKQKTEPKVDAIGKTIDLNKTSGTQLEAKKTVKKYGNLTRKKPYGRPPTLATVAVENEEVRDKEDTLNDLDTIAELQPDRNVQTAAKRISEKYKKMRKMKEQQLPSPKTIELPPEENEMVDSVSVATVSVKRTANKIKQNYADIRRKKALKLLKLRGNEQLLGDDKKENVFTKSARITAKKISDKFKKIRSKKAIDLVDEVQQVASKNAQITAKKISDKYKKMRYKKTPLPFNLNDIADAESIAYGEDINLNDTQSIRSSIIAASKIKNKYKKMRAKNNSFSFDLDEIEQVYTKNYVNDTDIADIILNRNAAIAPKKISEKYRTIRRKIKRSEPIEPIEGPPKRPKTSVGSKKSALLAAKKISDRYKKLRYK